MKRKYKASLGRLFFFSMALISLVSVISLGTWTISRDFLRNRSDLKAVRESFVADQKKQLKKEVEKAIELIAYQHSLAETRLKESLKSRAHEAISIAQNLYDQHRQHFDSENTQKIIFDALRPIRFNYGRGYYFATGLDGVELLFADRPEMEGQNLLPLRDSDGKYVIRDMINIAKTKGEGFYRYLWTKPDEKGSDFPKIAFVKYFAPIHGFIGTGEYIDNMEHDIQEELLRQIGNIRFGNNGYIFVVNYRGRTLMNGVQPELIGKNLWEMADPYGVKVIQEERRAAEKPNGDFIHYHWEKPSTGKISPKISFVKSYPPWEWMLGAGVYADEVEEQIASIEKKSRRNAFQKMGMMGLVLFGVFFFSLLISTLLSKNLSKEFNFFISSFQRMEQERTPIDVSRLSLKEIRTLGKSANKLHADRQKAEEALRQAQKMQSIGNLAGGIAHDFNNILFPIVGMSELLLEDLPKDSFEYQNVREILKAGKRGADLVKQILAFSRQTKQRMMPIRPQQILNEVLNLVRSTIPSNVTISHRIQNDCGMIHADPTQIHQVMMNLITNAYHAIEENNGEVIVTLKEEAVDHIDETGLPLPKGKYAVVRVADNGSGIDPKILDKIFDPYFTTKAPGRGTGLGLAVAYGIVKEHGGEIKVESRVGHGTTFSVFIPLVVTETAEDSFEELEIIPTGEENILLVDDEEPIIRMETQMLRRLGYQVTERTSSTEALKAFTANPSAFDLVVSDMSMPNMTGKELAQRIIEIRPDMPIIICTGFSEKIDQEGSVAAGVKGFLMKPIVRSELAKAVRRVLDEAKG